MTVSRARRARKKPNERGRLKNLVGRMKVREVVTKRKTRRHIDKYTAAELLRYYKLNSVHHSKKSRNREAGILKKSGGEDE